MDHLTKCFSTGCNLESCNDVLYYNEFFKVFFFLMISEQNLFKETFFFSVTIPHKLLIDDNAHQIFNFLLFYFITD